MANRFCKSCGVSVSEDLSNCPLCGKYILKDDEKTKLTKSSFPQYNYVSIAKEKAFKIVRNIVFYAIIICVLVNLVFITKPFWFPLAIMPLFCLYMIFIHPFRHGGSFLAKLPSGVAYASLMLIFIDAHCHLCYATKLGWAIGYAVPLSWFAIILTCAIIGFSSNKLCMYYVRQVPIIVIFSVIYLIVKLVFFKDIARWPSLLFVFSAGAWWVLGASFKKKLFKDEMKKDYHIN